MYTHFSTFYSSYVREDEAPDYGHRTYKIASFGVYTDKYSYGLGDTMDVGLDISYWGDDTMRCFALWIENPLGGVKIIRHAHNIPLPQGFEYSDPAFMTFVLPSIPAGVYTWHATLLDPSTHDIIMEDTAEWEFI
jgi:hypothetical protein